MNAIYEMLISLLTVYNILLPQNCLLLQVMNQEEWFVMYLYYTYLYFYLHLLKFAVGRFPTVTRYESAFVFQKGLVSKC